LETIIGTFCSWKIQRCEFSETLENESLQNPFPPNKRTIEKTWYSKIKQTVETQTWKTPGMRNPKIVETWDPQLQAWGDPRLQNFSNP
jgi:hypothetical protein